MWRALTSVLSVAFSSLVTVPASAEPSTHPIGFAFGGGPQQLQYHSIDINQDGVNDLEFRHFPEWGTGLPLPWAFDAVTGFNGTSVAVHSDSQLGEAQAIGKGQFIGPERDWGGGANIFDSGGLFGDRGFLEPDASLGVRLTLNGEPHYAWVHVQHVPGQGLGSPAAFLIKDTGWETAADTPIRTPGVPEPAALGSLAAGLLALHRRRRIP